MVPPHARGLEPTVVYPVSSLCTTIWITQQAREKLSLDPIKGDEMEGRMVGHERERPRKRVEERLAGSEKKGKKAKELKERPESSKGGRPRGKEKEGRTLLFL